MKKKIFFLLIIAVCLINPCFKLMAQTEWKNFLIKKVFSNQKGSLPYRIYTPDTITEKTPLLVFLHGAGERGSDNESQLLHGVKYFMSDSVRHNFPCIILVPQCDKKHCWAETDWTKPTHTIPTQISLPLELTFCVIDSLVKKLPIDNDRIYITGLSMGGFGTWDALARRTGFFAAAIIVCGGGDENTACLMSNTPIRAFHGKLDKLVIPVRTINMVNSINKCGGNAEMCIFPNLGHFCWEKVYSNVENIRWFFSQKRTK